jgi:hypothetical protein
MDSSRSAGVTRQPAPARAAPSSRPSPHGASNEPRHHHNHRRLDRRRYRAGRRHLLPGPLASVRAVPRPARSRRSSGIASRVLPGDDARPCGEVDRQGRPTDGQRARPRRPRDRTLGGLPVFPGEPARSSKRAEGIATRLLDLFADPLLKRKRPREPNPEGVEINLDQHRMPQLARSCKCAVERKCSILASTSTHHALALAR